MRRIGFALGSVLVLFLGFAGGFISCLHLKSGVSSEVRGLYLQDTGDAPTEVRSGVLSALRLFQDGYIKRDPNDIDAFADRLIAKNNDVLVLGTDSGEWVRGYSAAKEFIKADWQGWGDFKFNVDDSIVWSSGNVAWVTSIGAVNFNGLDRPVRFSAVLANDGSRWLFREIHFQWDEHDPSSKDLLRPQTYLTLVGVAFERMMKSTN